MSDPEHSVDLKSYLRRCAVIFTVVLCANLLMVATSFARLGDGWTLKVTLILAIAVVNALLVVGYLMHLLSEKKTIHAVLLFTGCFFIGLMGLTLWAMHDFPTGTAVH
jgi:caa(3)-type oxidase subunit IV